MLRYVGLSGSAAVLAACQPKVVEKIVKETVVVTEEKIVEKVVKEAVEVEKEVTRVVEQVVEKVVEKDDLFKGELISGITGATPAAAAWPCWTRLTSSCACTQKSR
jgi:hypothetical protein